MGTYSTDALNDYFSTTQGKALSEEQKAILNDIANENMGDARKQGTSLSDPQANQLMSDLNTWYAAQSSTSQAGTNYATTANAEQGRDSTILSGPGVTPYTTLLSPNWAQNSGRNAFQEQAFLASKVKGGPGNMSTAANVLGFGRGPGKLMG